ncbi:MAG: polysaccharide pyruvyl transferase family protein [Planctomycetales bacterium]|nr:polysaccharide pyruvyl transferase family protein [Planctomycetales bacterium]
MGIHSMQRREALAAMGVVTLGIQAAFSASERPKHVLLRSSWQTVNIGDIAHTPGLLNILETHLPDVQVTLWPSLVDNGVKELLMTRFPRLLIAQDSVAIRQAFRDCDFLLHGSGASLVAQRDVERWSKETNKPYGIYGITLPEKKSSSTEATSAKEMADTVRILSGARFVFFRDSQSLSLAKGKGCTAPLMQFGPDAAFGCDLRDDARAEHFLAENDLEPGKFLCCIPRLRYTPYWLIKDRPFEPIKHQRNEEMKEHDHAQLRQAIVEIVSNTDLKILICPEDQTQMMVGKELLFDKLPDKIRQRVVWRSNYWLTGEAISTYVRSAGLFGNEMHSPIMCVGHGVPAIVCRWAEQTSKGLMWKDIGLGDWLFDLDNADDVSRVVPAIMEIAVNPVAARSRAAAAKLRVEQLQRQSMETLAHELS